LKVKDTDGIGMTVDVLVVSRYVNEGDKAVFCTLDDPAVTNIMASWHKLIFFRSFFFKKTSTAKLLSSRIQILGIPALQLILHFT